MVQDFSSVNQAFTSQSVNYDIYDFQNPILLWMRKMVRNHVNNYLKEGDSMLELNAGTGLDACYFINEKKVKVHATDLTDGMVAEIEKKIENYQLRGKLSVQQCSYTDLENVNSAPFQYVFSNFGGINCVDDLAKITKDFSRLLSPRGHITLVIMQPICPWELIYALKGKFKYAFRRLHKEGVKAHLEGKYFMTYYFTPKDVMKALGKDYLLVDLQGLASFVPPPQSEKFPFKFPKLFEFLKKMDERFSRRWPFKIWGDHFIITVQYLPSN
jgi:ubiquinone/menaquinone biosynthesis C-methylase UbiE